VHAGNCQARLPTEVVSGPGNAEIQVKGQVPLQSVAVEKGAQDVPPKDFLPKQARVLAPPMRIAIKDRVPLLAIVESAS
jgi:hypothetical protein